jgi:hypothetical protein
MRGISASGQNQDLRTIKILQLWTERWKNMFFSVLTSLILWYQFVVHIGPKANINKTQRSSFTWFPKTGCVHGGSRLYIIRGMIQTLNSSQYNPTKPNVSLLHLVFLSNLLFFTLTVALALIAHLLYSCSLCLHL